MIQTVTIRAPEFVFDDLTNLATSIGPRFLTGQKLGEDWYEAEIEVDSTVVNHLDEIYASARVVEPSPRTALLQTIGTPEGHGWVQLVNPNGTLIYDREFDNDEWEPTARQVVLDWARTHNVTITDRD